MKAYEQTVFRVLRAIATERRPELAALEVNHTLTYDLGLSSLDLARAVATLEMELNADPFDRVPITSVRTVGDLCAAYQFHFNGKGEPPPAMSDQSTQVIPLSPTMPEDAAEVRRQARRA